MGEEDQQEEQAPPFKTNALGSTEPRKEEPSLRRNLETVESMQKLDTLTERVYDKKKKAIVNNGKGGYMIRRKKAIVNIGRGECNRSRTDCRRG